MASSKDFEKIWESYQDAVKTRSVSIVDYCQRNGIVYESMDSMISFSRSSMGCDACLDINCVFLNVGLERGTERVAHTHHIDLTAEQGTGARRSLK